MGVWTPKTEEQSSKPFRILIDSGCKYTILLGYMTPKLIIRKMLLSSGKHKQEISEPIRKFKLIFSYQN